MAQFSSSFHRNSLLRTKQYLAGSLFPSSAVWTRSGKMDTLTKVMPGPVNPDRPAAPDAIIIAVGIVSEDQLKVTPVGNWSTYTSETNKKIEFAKDSKYTFLIISPKNGPVFAIDFPVYIAALKKQQNSVSKTGIDKWLLAKDSSDDTIIFSFKVFEPKTATNSNTDINIKMCPVPTECWDELAKIARSHVIHPFIVYNTDGSIVEPLGIPSKLLGTLVECSFGIIYYHFSTDDSFSGIINQVMILYPAQVKPPSLFKASSRPDRLPTLSLEQVYAQEEKAVESFALPISHLGLSNLPVPRSLKCKASKEPEGSSSKHINTGEVEIVSKDGNNNKDAETIESELEKDTNDKGKTPA
ncbi:hypothetical protein DFH08DRAFT_805761 [Mycena albidolilacea]|uniref:Uncharacterized protein n=1 Tax=Mycena albidolilacea TaxID=1033008 RepID=A0AAD7A992_9AGAR|nr:hypothetical protein DFH08DRAFT_805761 [Mycena albidolilacea]